MANPPTMPPILKMIVVADIEGHDPGQMTTGTIAGMIRARTSGNRRGERHVVVASQVGAMTSNRQMATMVTSRAPSMMPRRPIRWKTHARRVICALTHVAVQIGPIGQIDLIRAVATLRATTPRVTGEVVRVMTGSNSHQPGVRGDRGAP
jgi:hypothetical protein